MISFDKLLDSQNRRLDYLRVSITDKCNLQCVYCNPDGITSKLEHSEILTYEEMLRLIKLGVSIGIRKIRITGGEPLIRKGVCGFIKKISCIENLADLSLTTNGVFLLENAVKIKESGINRINISLDSLNPIKYKKITKFDKFEKVWNGIMLVHELNFTPIKINVVVIKGVNDDEIINFAKLTFLYPFHVRFIEYMPIGAKLIEPKYQILTPEIKKKLSVIGDLESLKNDNYDGPASRFKFDGAIGEVGFISPLSSHFCSNCNRIRLTADGKLRSCLLSDVSISIKDLIRNGGSNDVLHKAFVSSALTKNSRHCVMSKFEEIVDGKMYNIGG